MDALLFTVGEAFCRQPLSEATFNLEYLQLAFYLATNHHDKSVTKHQEAVGDDKRLFALEPLVKLMLLGKDVDTAFVQHIIFIVWFVQADTTNGLIFRRMNGPRDALLTQQPVEVIVGQFRKRCASHVRQFHFRLFRGGVARVSLGDICRC